VAALAAQVRRGVSVERGKTVKCEWLGKYH